MKRITIPNKNNFCGGNFKDWMEIMLIEKCNGCCSWCVDKDGFHPKEHADTDTLIKVIIRSKISNLILLGGEPTLYPELKKLIEGVKKVKDETDRKIYITTNGSLLTPWFIQDKLSGLTGINISIHHYDLYKNYKITGINLNELNLKNTIDRCKKLNITVRLNCNIIKDNIDSEVEIKKYIKFVKELGADSVRFAELKVDKEKFISLGKILNYQYGLNEEPFTKGCNKSAIIDEIEVFFRQMCGIQTENRKFPINPKLFYKKAVLYYNGVIYDSWKKEEVKMTKEKFMKMSVAAVKEVMRKQIEESRELTQQEIELIIKTNTEVKKFDEPELEGHCCY